MEANNPQTPIIKFSTSIQIIPQNPTPKILLLECAGLAPFSAVAPPQIIQVSRLQVDTTLDTIIEEPAADDYSSIEESWLPSSEDVELLQETSELVLEMAKYNSYMTCFREMQEKAFPSLSFNFRFV